MKTGWLERNVPSHPITVLLPRKNGGFGTSGNQHPSNILSLNIVTNATSSRFQGLTITTFPNNFISQSFVTAFKFQIISQISFNKNNMKWVLWYIIYS